MLTHNKLNILLELNYRLLGFRLENFEVIKTETFNNMLRFILWCPCGRGEYINCILDNEYDPEREAEDLLLNTASRHHLEDDVKSGRLSPFDIDKYVFKSLVLIEPDVSACNRRQEGGGGIRVVHGGSCRCIVCDPDGPFGERNVTACTAQLGRNPSLEELRAQHSLTNPALL